MASFRCSKTCEIVIQKAADDWQHCNLWLLSGDSKHFQDMPSDHDNAGEILLDVLSSHHCCSQIMETVSHEMPDELV